MNQNQNRTWLIRYHDNSFSRPLSESELMKLFSEGAMKPQDEIAAGNGYWFSLQDVKEMRKHFGNMPMDRLFKKSTEEVTQERFVVTAPIAVPPQVHAGLKTSAQKVNLPEDSIQSTSPLMKALLIVLTIVVVTLLFVWFG